MNVKKSIVAGVAIVAALGVVTAAALAPSTSPAAPTPTPSPSALSLTNENSTSDDASYTNRWKYTQADYEFAIALLTPDYEQRSVADFNRSLLDWRDEDTYHKGEERLERLMCSYPSDKPNAAFINDTIRASYQEINTHHYGGNCPHMAPNYWGNATWERTEDVFGDKLVVFTADACFDVKYRITDENAITIGARDKIFRSYDEAVQALLNSKTEQALKDEKAMTDALKKELARLDQKLSTDNLKLSSVLDDYCADDYRDWY